MCRLGIESEQTSDTHQLAAAPASSRHRPRSSSLLQRLAANRIRKKEQRRRRLARAYEAQTYASWRRFRCKFNALAIFRIASRARETSKSAQRGALSDVEFNALAIFGSPGAAEPFRSRIQCTRDHHRAAAAAIGRRRAPWPGKRPAPPVHRAKIIQRGPRRPRATRANG